MSEENTQEAQDPSRGEEPIEEPQQEDQTDVYDLSREAALLSERESELSSMAEELNTRLEKVSSMEEQFDALKADPVKLLESLGMTYDDVTNGYLDTLGDKTKTESEIILEKINSLESQVSSQAEGLQRRDEEATKLDQQEKYDSALREVTQFVGSNSEQYELVKRMDAADLVLNVVAEHYENTKEILDMATACQAVEEYYEEEAERYVASDKILGKLGLRKADAPQGKQDTRPKTLTNNIGTKAPRYNNEDKPMTREESLEKAASLLRWE